MSIERTEVRVQPAVASDAPAVAAIWHSGWADGHAGHVPDELVAVRTEESFHRRAAERVRDTTVALVGDQIAGFVMVAGDEVEQVYVSAAHRGSGIADVLLTEAERLVRLGGHDQAWLAVVAGNARARRFYERSGWVDAGRFEYAAPDFDGTVPCRRYVKTLA